MLRDLFFSIWGDELGMGWHILIVGLFFLFLAIVIIVVARTKALGKKFGAKHYLFFAFALLVMYQIIPVCFDFVAQSYSVKPDDPYSQGENLSKAVKFEKLAIKTAIIPYQKGGYYIKLAQFYSWGSCPSQMVNAYKKAHDYIKNYEYIVWLQAGMNTFFYGYYDEAIEISNHSGYRAYPDIFLNHPETVLFFVLERSYIMKGDYENALIFVNKLLERKDTYPNLALKAYILKQMGQKAEAKVFYEKAVEMCDNSHSLKLVNEIYNDFVGEEKKDLEEKLSKKCVISE